ncbi:phosphotransferase enzyme family protein [Alkalihalobacillus trypoxylicola]|uniref:Protein kinase n=1 Tax=Alkalihalobacillus trypoxylicola TaxID=519424 RepID=A0A162CR08_9BACI|nr:phosphotransferase [Alkalihalobacillus trypoxylicola]KYG26077.1 protein kinase [Alkalihalobacillus trypoxylicola]
MKQGVLEKLNKIYPIKFIKVDAVTNEMYRCETKQGIYFARMTNYKTYDEQLDEVTYTNFLYNEGLGVTPIIPSSRGKLVEKITLGEDLLTVLFKKAPGEHLPRSQWNATVLKEVGRQIGILHRLSIKYESMKTVTSINDWYKNEEYAFLKYIPKEESTIRDVAHEILSTIKSLPQNDSTYGLLHGDLCLENILMDHNSKITMIDFQDCEKNYYLFDLAVPIYSAIEYSFVGNGNIVDYQHSITKAIIEGYREEHELSAEMLEKLPLFIKLKEIFEYSLMHMYGDKDKITEEQIRIMNHFRIRIEHNHSLLSI